MSSENRNNQAQAQKHIEDHIKAIGTHDIKKLLEDNAVGRILYMAVGLGYEIVPHEEINSLRNLRDAIGNVEKYPSSSPFLRASGVYKDDQEK